MGESKLRVNADESLRLGTFGEAEVRAKGKAEINKITFGEVCLKK